MPREPRDGMRPAARIVPVNSGFALGAPAQEPAVSGDVPWANAGATPHVVIRRRKPARIVIDTEVLIIVVIP